MLTQDDPNRPVHLRRPSSLSVWGLLLLLLCLSTAAWAGSPRLRLTPRDSEPDTRRHVPTATEIGALSSKVDDDPKDRRARFNLVHSLMKQEAWDEALREVRAWRDKDAYNLVVVRLQGDILMAMGRADEAERVYSAVVELLSDDARAHRALATVLKGAGDLEGAYTRLLRAVELAPDDARMAFELADMAHRTGRTLEARQRFMEVITNEKTNQAVRVPAAQRLGQVLSDERRAALARGDRAEARALGERLSTLSIHGGVDNDLKIFLTWDTDRTDVDLWVISPTGEKINYQNKQGRHGGQLFGDVTQGYGPESFTAHRAISGTYKVVVHFFGKGRSTFGEARGEVVVVLDEGRETQERIVLPYRLFDTGQAITIATIDVR
ncbi:MAG: tetratricopeptide repeat protein [Myxococcota bacterium]|nr:tetratricopeptide repeat protein [Myxococcota bacterium]